jgi:hypothetical protein
MKREEALELLHQNLKDKNLRRHCYAVETVLKSLARKLNEDEELWGLVGLLHDVDYEITEGDPARHGIEGAELLEQKGISKEICQAVKAHNPYHGKPVTVLEKAVYAADPVTGFIVAAALVHPDKKLVSLDISFLLKRFREKSFARGANREQMESIKELGLSLEEFLDLSLKAMQETAPSLGL